MNYATLIAALIKVESGGRADAVGDNGKALGILQIWDVVVQDVNKIYRKAYTHTDALVPERAKEICRLYLTYYVAKAKGVRMDEYELAARIWNGGPTGYLKKATLPYWRRVNAVLNQLSPTP